MRPAHAAAAHTATRGGTLHPSGSQGGSVPSTRPAHAAPARAASRSPRRARNAHAWRPSSSAHARSQPCSSCSPHRLCKQRPSSTLQPTLKTCTACQYVLSQTHFKKGLVNNTQGSFEQLLSWVCRQSQHRCSASAAPARQGWPLSLPQAATAVHCCLFRSCSWHHSPHALRRRSR